MEHNKRDARDRILNPTLADLLELANRVGEQRFGSECRHERTAAGRCLNCLRPVVTKPPVR